MTTQKPKRRGRPKGSKDKKPRKGTKETAAAEQPATSVEPVKPVESTDARVFSVDMPSLGGENRPNTTGLLFEVADEPQQEVITGELPVESDEKETEGKQVEFDAEGNRIYDYPDFSKPFSITKLSLSQPWEKAADFAPLKAMVQAATGCDDAGADLLTRSLCGPLHHMAQTSDGKPSFWIDLLAVAGVFAVTVLRVQKPETV